MISYDAYRLACMLSLSLSWCIVYEVHILLESRRLCFYIVYLIHVKYMSAFFFLNMYVWSFWRFPCYKCPHFLNFKNSSSALPVAAFVLDRVCRSASPPLNTLSNLSSSSFPTKKRNHHFGSISWVLRKKAHSGI